MRRVRKLGFVVLLCLGAVAIEAAEPRQVAWQTDVTQAWQSAQVQGRPLLVFVTTDHCLYCVKMKKGTWNDQRIVAAINAGYVPLVLDGSEPSPLLKDLAVNAFPTTFVISSRAVVLERIDGYVKPEVLAARLAALGQPAVGRVASSR